MDAPQEHRKVPWKEMYLNKARVEYPSSREKPKVDQTARECLEKHEAGCECWRTRA